MKSFKVLRAKGRAKYGDKNWRDVDRNINHVIPSYLQPIAYPRWMRFKWFLRELIGQEPRCPSYLRIPETSPIFGDEHLNCILPAGHKGRHKSQHLTWTRGDDLNWR